MSASSGLRPPSTRWIGSAAACLLLASIAWSLSQSYAPQIRLSLARSSGWLAFLTLALTLCVTPLSRLASRVRPSWTTHTAVYRRALGITCACLAWVHAALGSLDAYDGSFAWLTDSAHMRGGLSALLMLTALGWTSFPRGVRALSLRAWKELHRLSYVAFACAAQHTLLSPFAPRRWVLSTLGATLLIGLLRVVARRERKPTSQPVAPLDLTKSA